MKSLFDKFESTYIYNAKKVNKPFLPVHVKTVFHLAKQNGMTVLEDGSVITTFEQRFYKAVHAHNVTILPNNVVKIETTIKYENEYESPIVTAIENIELSSNDDTHLLLSHDFIEVYLRKSVYDYDKYNLFITIKAESYILRNVVRFNRATGDKEWLVCSDDIPRFRDQSFTSSQHVIR